MSKSKLTSGIVFMLVLVLTQVQAQEAIPATGGEASGGGGSASYTVGQTAYTISTGITGTVAPGVQHAYLISVETGIEETAISLSITAYPNPTTDILNLKTDIESLDLSIHLYNINGKLLQSKKLDDNKTSIDMSGLAPSIYFMKVFDNQHEVKTFKIIKK